MVEPFDRSVAVGHLRTCLTSGTIGLSRHFREELANEALAIEDAYCVLKAGQIYDPPELDVRTREWKYRLEGREPGGKWLILVFSFKQWNRAYMITVFSEPGRGRTQ